MPLAEPMVALLHLPFELLVAVYTFIDCIVPRPALPVQLTEPPWQPDESKPSRRR